MSTDGESIARPSSTKLWMAVIVAILVALLLAGCTAGGDQGQASEKKAEECAKTETRVAKAELSKPGKIAFSKGGDVYTMNPDGSEQTNLTKDKFGDDIYELAPDWSPDGKSIAFASFREGRDGAVYVINADGTGLRRLSKGQFGVEDPSWSPDGERIAYTAETGVDQFVLMTMNSDGTDSTVIRKGPVPGYINYSDWSPDGSRIVFSEDRSPAGYGEIDTYTMNPDGTCVEQLTDTPEDDSQATWSPDGEKILFGSDRNGGGIYTMKPDGTDETRILKAPQELSEYAPVEEYRSAWSPDGKRIVWAGWYEGNTGSKIYVMNADGSGLTAIHGELETVPYVDWQPVGD